jgi:hypothetical protein
MTQGIDNRRWSFTFPTPLGDSHASYEVSDDDLHFETDDLFGGGSDTLRWDSIQEGGTAAMAGMGGRGSPDLPGWVPARLEWLTLSRTADSGKAFMRVLPQGPDRDAIVAAVQGRLGSRWIGERVPLKEAHKRLQISSNDFGTLKVIGIVAAVLAMLAALLVLMGLLFHPVISVPAGFLIGGWLGRNGLLGLRDGIAVANTPTARAASAALGLVELEGRAVTAHPSPAGITGRPSVWWDVAVYFWSKDDKNNGQWRQVASRYGGTIDVVDLEDDTGRLPVWLKGADLLLETHAWESEKDVLPAPGAALLDELGFPWTSNKKMRVTEESIEANATLYVLGTLDERRNLPESRQARGLEHMMQLVRTGEWRRALVSAMPGPVRFTVAVLIGLLDMFTQIGKGGERVKRADVAAPPDIAPAALLVWKGRSGRPFLVSNHRSEPAALAALRKRSLILCGIGAAVLCYTLYQFVELLLGK